MVKCLLGVLMHTFLVRRDDYIIRKAKRGREMEEQWSLDSLYSDYTDIRWVEDMKRTDELIKQFTEFGESIKENDSLTNLTEGLRLLEALSDTVTKLMTYTIFRQSVCTSDPESASNMGRLNEKISLITKPMTKMKHYIATLHNLDEVIEQSEFLKEYSYLLHCYKEDSKHMLGEEAEEVMAKYDISGGKSWEDLQSYLTSSLKVEYDGKEIPLSSVRNLAYSKDGAVRKKAYEAELKAYDKIKDSVAFSLNSIKLQVLNECKLRGYESPLEKTLQQSHMTKKTLDALMEAIKEFLPKFREYLKIKAKVLGHENGLPWYDLFAPMGENSSHFTIEEARDYLIQLFETFDQDLANMVTTAFEKAWIDFYPRDGKVGGAYCCNIAPIKESRILTNFDGSFSDVVTLAHELGHAFHNFNLLGHRALNTDYSMPVAETASIFNENIIMNAAIKAAENEQSKLALIESQMQDVTQIICDIYSRYLFETAVFEHRSENFMFADTLCDMMVKAQKEAYGDGVNATTLNSYMWVCKTHYYSTTTSFYNFPYAFGGLFAKGLYAKYEQEKKEFVPKYKKLLHATPVMSVEEVAKIAEIDLTDKEFWKLGLKSYEQQIDILIDLLSKEK